MNSISNSVFGSRAEFIGKPQIDPIMEDLENISQEDSPLKQPEDARENYFRISELNNDMAKDLSTFDPGSVTNAQKRVKFGGFLEVQDDLHSERTNQ